jgi:murein L,D-transpeptidase YcbB/YkuD
LLNSRRRERIPSIVKRLDCRDRDYLILKKYLHDSISVTDTFKCKTVLLAMNYRRYFTVNHQSEYIVVNIPTTEAEYYKNDLLALKMKTVVGRKDKQTPVFASYITNIITFPHWTVPHDIGVNEILPKVQKNANYLEQNSFDIIDSKGNDIDESGLNWSDYNAKNFPYTFRQSTGQNNALGVLKFELQNPFSIFLHATNSNSSFAKDNRFLSHGCIRLEKPFELADALLRGEIDVAELKNGKSNTVSNSIKLPHKTPTFIIYLPLKIIEENIIFLKDVYNLVK